MGVLYVVRYLGTLMYWKIKCKLTGEYVPENEIRLHTIRLMVEINSLMRRVDNKHI